MHDTSTCCVPMCIYMCIYIRTCVCCELRVCEVRYIRSCVRAPLISRTGDAAKLPPFSLSAHHMFTLLFCVVYCCCCYGCRCCVLVYSSGVVCIRPCPVR